MPNDREATSPLLAQALSERFHPANLTCWEKRKKKYDPIRQYDGVCRFLRKHFGPNHPLTIKIDSCEPTNRCLSGACTQCMRALQHWFVHEVTDLEESWRPNAYFASWVVETCPLKGLESLSTARIAVKAKSLLKKADVEFAVGGFDFSFNTNVPEHADHWAIQLWFLTLGKNWTSNISTSSFPAIKRPLKTYKFDQCLKAPAYALKNSFARRVSYENTNELRTYLDTRMLPLRVKEKKVLWPFLDREGFHRRLFLVGVRPTKTAEGIKLRRLTPNSENRESG